MKKNTGLCLGLIGFFFLSNGVAANFSTITDVSNGQGNNYVLDFVTQADGKALVTGFYYDNILKRNGSFVLRHTTAGALDATFGTNGIAMFDLLPGGEFSTLNKLGVLSNGQVLLVGQISQNATQKLLLARLNANGALDTTFGTNGYVLTEFTNIHPNVSHLTIQNDDSFFLTLSNKTAVSIVKFNSDGTLDTNFATNGVLISDISEGMGSFSTATAVQNDGKLVVTGGYLGNGFKAGFVARYSAAGVLDNSFGTNGVAQYHTSNTSTDYFSDVSIQNDGKIVVTGSSTDNSNNKTTMLLLRYATNGSLDATFATAGVLNSCPNYVQDDCYGLKVMVKVDGNLLVGSQLISGGSTLPVLYQFNTNGTLVNDYGTNGSKAFQNVSTIFNFSANRLDNDGNDVLAGSAQIGDLYKVVLMSE